MVTRSGCAAALVSGLLLALGCKPDIEGRPSVVVGPRLLAIRSTPAEVAPKPGSPTEVSYDALFVDVDGTRDGGDLNWSLCSSSKPLTASGPVAPACLLPSGPALEPVGNGSRVEGVVLPEDACSIFGPLPPEPKEGETTTPRPPDPDTTGGYYQPVRVGYPVDDDVQYSVGVTRLNCDRRDVNQEQALELVKRYRENENPALAAVEVRGGSGNEDLSKDDADVATIVAPGRVVTLRATWNDCPEKATCEDGICGEGEDSTSCPADCENGPKGCTGAEPYVAIDTVTHALTSRRERIRVSWFSTHGSFVSERTGRAEGDRETFTENTWTAPTEAGLVHLWVVIRDDRGGVGYGSFKIDVHR